MRTRNLVSKILWSFGRKEKGERRIRRKEQWNLASITSVGRLHQLAHQCKWRNHEPEIWEWKIIEWPKFWKVNQWKNDEIPRRHELVEWENSL